MRGPGLLAQARGGEGEETAVAYLSRLGYRILERNFKTRYGEIDVVARDGETTVFVEVKRREAVGHGSASDLIKVSQTQRVVGAARIYAAKHRLSESLIRFDVVAIDVRDGHEQIRHHKGAFDAS